MLTIGAYPAVSAITNVDGPSESPALSNALAPPAAGRLGPLIEPITRSTPEVVSAFEVAPTPTRAPPPAEAPTEATVDLAEDPVYREPAAQPAPEPPPEPDLDPTSPPPPPAGNFRYDMAGAIASLFNDARSQRGLGSVAGNGSLSTAAQAYAEYHYLNYGPYDLSHTHDGAPADRATRAGYSWSYLGEVIASGGSSAQAFIDMWMNSGPHHDIILDGTYVDVGVGCYENVGQPILSVAMFGSPSG